MPLSDQELRQQFILADVFQERRSRREPEHALTAAMVAYTSAVIWGVATLATINSEKKLAFGGAIITGIGSILIAVAICAKIWASHRQHVKNQAALKILVDDCIPEAEREHLPGYMKVGKAGGGVWWSILVVIVSALVALGFSVFIAFKG